MAVRLLCLAAAVAGAATTRLQGQISIPSGGKFSGKSYMSSTRLILDGGVHEALPSADGSFEIDGVSEGAHSLQVAHPELKFEPVFVETTSRRDGTLQVNAFQQDIQHGKQAKLKYPLSLSPTDTVSYFEAREEFNILSVLYKNPMMLMMVFMGGMMFLLPKLQPDPETLKQLQQPQASEEAPARRKAK
mmetsp:Transcript_28204/g.67739  ORF Transcript_28204/g.67739 Transcript_28204/m.67739 type:complete len:189 (-) Transcript_28204:191-757(-)